MIDIDDGIGKYIVIKDHDKQLEDTDRDIR